MKKLNNIQAMRGFAVLAVVFFHLIIIERKYGGGNTLLPGLLEFGMFGVDLFFVISGFVMVTVTRGKFRVVKEALLFLYHRASRIYPLYWLYTFAALAVFLIQPAWVNSSQGNRVDILSSFLLLPSNLLPLVQVGWTLIHEMYFYLVFFLIMLLVPERFLVLAIAIWGGVLLALGSWAGQGNPTLNLVLHPLTFEFLAGCLLAMLFHHTERSPFDSGWLMMIASAALIAALVGYASFRAQTGLVSPDGWLRVGMYGIPAIIIVYCLTNAERSGFTFHAAFIETGNASYSIYLSHLFTLNVVGRIWAFFATDGFMDNIIGILIALIAAIAVGFMSYRLLEIPLLKLSRKVM
ncbi:MAG TPA: acyltransferase [Anaerolineales bacterium]|nr:acyltransferase [Anaerolineales bacterium]HNN12616.1 acyltransferase [Anaerolineales bacterium]HNO31659.1 acyltransferase [Anaerolineales bacterium]